MTDHIDSIRTYALVLLALLALTAVTTLVAFVDLGEFSVVVALGIAVCKMLLVALFLHACASQHQAHEAGGARRVTVAGDPAHADAERFHHAGMDRRAGTVGSHRSSWLRPAPSPMQKETSGTFSPYGTTRSRRVAAFRPALPFAPAVFVEPAFGIRHML